MNWDSIQLAAKAKGNLIFAIDQAQTAVLTQPGPWGSAFDGYCIGLAASWISLAYQGREFPYDAGKVCDNPPVDATQAQNLSDASSKPGWADWWGDAVEPYRCRLSDGLRAERGTKPTAAFLWSIVSCAYGCYGVYMKGDGGAHAIALRHGRDNRIHIFDANYYHAAAKSGDAFKTLLQWHLDQSGYSARYNKKTGIIGIKPPING